MLLEVGVKALIKNPQGKYLILKRLNPYPGEKESRWDAPGGRINIGETLFDALRREIKEETDLKMVGAPQIINAQDILRVKTKHTVRLTFTTKASGKVKMNPEEHSEYKWLSLSDLKKLHCDMYLTPVLSAL